MKKLKFKKDVAHASLRDERSRLLYHQNPFSVQEAYRSARTNLMFLPQQTEGRGQILVITSANMGEGKSTSCANLSIVLAQNGKRVLLIDCDMRSPKQNKLMDYPQSPGLSEYLAGIESTLTVRRNEYVDSLDVVTAGSAPPNPAELLSSPKMQKLLAGVSQEYDYIMLDTPPINLVADALVVKAQVDGYVLIVRADHTNRTELDHALLRLQQVEAHVFGFVLNDVNPKSGKYGKYGRYGRYGRYGKYGKYGEYGAYGNYDANVYGDQTHDTFRMTTVQSHAD